MFFFSKYILYDNAIYSFTMNSGHKFGMCGEIGYQFYFLHPHTDTQINSSSSTRSLYPI